MSTECNGKPIVFQGHHRREITASFDGGRLSSCSDALLLREADNVFGVTGLLAGCFSDHRAPEPSEHGLDCLFAQRVMAIALGYEDLNDHNQLRDDSVLALTVGRVEITGADRVRDRGHPLASSSTLNRLEFGIPDKAASDRYKDSTAYLAHEICGAELSRVPRREGPRPG